MNKYPPTVDGLLAIMRKLRSPEGCPWDRKQSYQSLCQTLAEETSELIDAVDNKDIAEMREEIGDIMMNLVFYAVIAEERGDFSFADIMAEINSKMIRRHPHVFGEAEAADSDEVLKIWNAIKKDEKHAGRESAMDGIPKNLSALLQAEKIQKRAAHYGFDWEKPEQIIEKIEEELDELKQAFNTGNDDEIDEELGDLFFAVSNLSRFRKGATAEDLLRRANRKFMTRFRHIEQKLAEQNKSLEDSNIVEMGNLWNDAKRNEVLKL